MKPVFVVTNQDGMFASKQKEWVDGREPKSLFRSPHKDEALNIVFELSSKDIQLRAEAISVELDNNKQPIIDVTAPEQATALELDDDQPSLTESISSAP